MVLGGTMSMLLKLEVDISEIGKLAKAQRAVRNFEAGAAQSFQQVSSRSRGAVNDIEAVNRAMGLSGQQALSTGTNMDRLSRNIDAIGSASRGASRASTGAFAMIAEGAMSLASSVGDAVGSVQKLRIAFLNMMFAGLNAVFLFGAILALSPRVRAGFSSIVASLRLVAIEAGEILGPKLRGLAKAIRNLSEDQKELIATIAVVGTVFGALLTVTGVLGGLLITTASGARILGGALKFLSAKIGLTSVMQSIMANGIKGTLIGALKSLKAVITGTLIPALKKMAAAALANPYVLLGVALLALIGIFIKFKKVRQLFSGAMSGMQQAALDFQDKALFKLKRGMLDLQLTIAKARLELFRISEAIGDTIIDKFRKGVERTRELINSLNKLRGVDIDTSGLPKAEDFALDKSELNKKMKGVKDTIDDLEQERNMQSIDLMMRKFDNDEAAEKTEKNLDKFLKANKDLTIGGVIKDALGMGGEEDITDEDFDGSRPGREQFMPDSQLPDTSSNQTDVPNLMKKFSSAQDFSFNEEVMSQMRSMDTGNTSNSTDANDRVMKQEIVNEIRIENPQLENEQDIDELADELVRRAERKQRRNKAAP